MSKSEEKEGVIIIKKEQLWKYATFILLAIIIVGAFVFFNKPTIPQQNQNTNVIQNPVNIPLGDSPVIGDTSAKVTVVIFSDFSCPFCGAASGQASDYVALMKSQYSGWEAPVPGIMKDYVQTGKVKFVFKYFPGHGAGEQAQLVGWCLNDQGLFWKFHDMAFADLTNTNNLAAMKEIAASLGADMPKLNSCLSTNKYESRLEQESSLGSSLGIGGTPTFFVNGKMVEGAVSYSEIRQTIDAELAA